VKQDARAKKRFSFNKPMVAKFEGLPVTLVDLSQTGAQIAHVEPIAGHSEGFLSVDVPGRATNIKLRARVMWTRRDGTERVSGLAITEERADKAADLLEYFLYLRKVQLQKKPIPALREAAPLAEAKQSTLEALHEIDETKPVIAAKDYLARFPSAASKWRAVVQRSCSSEERAMHSLDVLAVWELLNRGVRIEVVEFVFQLL
jgi:hypothetical protein